MRRLHPLVYLFLLMALYPLVFYLPAHLLLKKIGKGEGKRSKNR